MSLQTLKHFLQPDARKQGLAQIAPFDGSMDNSWST